MAGFEKSSLPIAQRARTTLIIAGVLFFLLAVRLWQLQVLRGDELRLKSENNRLATVFVAPPRGLIFDRNGLPLVKNRPAFEVDLIPEYAKDIRATTAALAELLGEDPNELLERARDSGRRRRFEPRVLLRDVSRDTVAKVAARKFALPGVVVNVSAARDYMHGDLAAHVLGYIREITRAQLELPQFSEYRQGDLVGQFGLEQRWERFLQGSAGVQRVVVNATGNRIGEFSYIPEKAGYSMFLTIDYLTQKAADDALIDKEGAIVALDPRSGEILAMSSAPRFNPNMFTGEVSGKEWKDLMTERKLLNRAVQGAYPPGSTFKGVMAVAALDSGVIESSDKVFCRGFLPFGGRNFRCHKKTGHGAVDIHDALVGSCDVYFYTVGQRLGIDRIHEYATMFGLGVPTGIELGEEVSGLIPSTRWKRTFFKNPANQRWHPGETLSVAIGQGAVLTTPLQLAVNYAELSNGGRRFKPHLVRRIQSLDGSFIDDNFPPEEVGRAAVGESVLEEVRKGLIGVVNEAGGTARRARLDMFPQITVAGKTGTAQVVGLEHTHKDEDFGDHAWFVGFAPAENPEIVVAALVENAGHGGVIAAPVVRQVMEAYFTSTRGLPVPPGVLRPEIPSAGKREPMPQR